MDQDTVPKRVFLYPDVAQYQRKWQHPVERSDAKMNEKEKYRTDVHRLFLVDNRRELLDQVSAVGKFFKHCGTYRHEQHHEAIAITVGLVDVPIVHRSFKEVAVEVIGGYSYENRRHNGKAYKHQQLQPGERGPPKQIFALLPVGLEK